MDQSLHHLRFAAERLGAHLPPGARILDFGCGQGRSVQALAELGYDAFGVDVLDHWNTFDTVPAETRKRLFVVPTEPCKLPFPDAHFDFCFSDQVLEHVFDYTGIFAELCRVLKGSGLSVHRFPGPNKPMESHINLPIPWLCHSRSYLTAWAVLGRRSPGQERLSWRETVAHNEYLMRHNNYPTKAQLRAHAASAGAEIAFREREEFAFRRTGPKAQALVFLSPFMSRYMTLQRAPSYSAEVETREADVARA
jgi:SAM-dependent methyltransferase